MGNVAGGVSGSFPEDIWESTTPPTGQGFPTNLPNPEQVWPNQDLSNEDREHLQRELELLDLRIAAERNTIKSSAAIIHHCEETYDQLKHKHHSLDMQLETEWIDHQADIDQVVMLNHKMPSGPFIDGPRGTSCRIAQPSGYEGLRFGGEGRSLVDQYDDLRLNIWNFDHRIMRVMIDAFVELDRKIRHIEELLNAERDKLAVAEHTVKELECRKLAIERTLGI